MFDLETQYAVSFDRGDCVVLRVSLILNNFIDFFSKVHKYNFIDKS